MNRKEYGLLVEEWRKFINESDETSLRDLHLHRSRSGKVTEPLSVGKEETYKSGMVKTTLSLKDGGRGPAPAPRTGAARILNPFRLICAQLFVYGENLLTSPVGKTHHIRFKEQIKRILDRQARILHTVLSVDETTRERQLDVIFSVLQKYFPKLNDSSNNTYDYISDNEEELKSYILKWKEMCTNSQIQDMCKEIVVALFAKGLLLEQLIGEDPNLDDEGDQQIDDVMYDEMRTKDNFNSKTN